MHFHLQFFGGLIWCPLQVLLPLVLVMEGSGGVMEVDLVWSFSCLSVHVPGEEWNGLSLLLPLRTSGESSWSSEETASLKSLRRSLVVALRFRAASFGQAGGLLSSLSSSSWTLFLHASLSAHFSACLNLLSALSFQESQWSSNGGALPSSSQTLWVL